MTMKGFDWLLGIFKRSAPEGEPQRVPEEVSEPEPHCEPEPEPMPELGAPLKLKPQCVVQEQQSKLPLSAAAEMVEETSLPEPPLSIDDLDDEFGLFDDTPVVQTPTSDELLIARFEEINAFVDVHDCEPSADGDNSERVLASRLKWLRSDSEQSTKECSILQAVDRHHLLPQSGAKLYPAPEDATDGLVCQEPQIAEPSPSVLVPAPTSLDDLPDDDPFGILEDDDDEPTGIFNVRPELTPPAIWKSPKRDDIAERKKCEDFAQFEPLFRACQADLVSKERILKPFSSANDFVVGNFFLRDGLMLYIAEVGVFESRADRQKARLRCIYENGMESNILTHSLAGALYESGKLVSARSDELLNHLRGITSDDQKAGVVYVLRSLRKKNEVKLDDGVVKIGFTRGDVKDRIKNAINEPSYLMAKVQVLRTYDIYNANTQGYEKLLHHFFDSARYEIDVRDHDGNLHHPKEWFKVPVPLITQVVALLYSGEIVKYRYNRDTENIELIPEDESLSS